MDPNIYALVLDTLNRATSQDTEVLKPAEKKLQEWEIEPGFYSVLLVKLNLLVFFFSKILKYLFKYSKNILPKKNIYFCIIIFSFPIEDDSTILFKKFFFV